MGEGAGIRGTGGSDFKLGLGLNTTAFIVGINQAVQVWERFTKKSNERLAIKERIDEASIKMVDFADRIQGAADGINKLGGITEDNKKSFDILGKKLNDATNKAFRLQGSIDADKKALEMLKPSFVTTVSILATAGAAVGALVAGFINLSAAGAKIESISYSFDMLASSVGQLSEVLRVELTEASRNTINQMTLMENANRAMVAGLPETVTLLKGEFATLPKMMEIAVASAIAMGSSTQYMFESIVLGTIRQSRLILDNLGIIIRQTDVYAAEEKKLGHALSAEAKQQVFTTAVVEAGAKTLERMGNIAGLNVFTFLEFKTASENLGNAIKTKLTTTAVPLVEMLTNLEKGFTRLITQTPIWVAQAEEANEQQKKAAKNYAEAAQALATLIDLEEQYSDASTIRSKILKYYDSIVGGGSDLDLKFYKDLKNKKIKMWDLTHEELISLYEEFLRKEVDLTEDAYVKSIEKAELQGQRMKDVETKILDRRIDRAKQYFMQTALAFPDMPMIDILKKTLDRSLPDAHAAIKKWYTEIYEGAADTSLDETKSRLENFAEEAIHDLTKIKEASSQGLLDENFVDQLNEIRGKWGAFRGELLTLPATDLGDLISKFSQIESLMSDITKDNLPKIDKYAKDTTSDYLDQIILLKDQNKEYEKSADILRSKVILTKDEKDMLHDIEVQMDNNDIKQNNLLDKEKERVEKEHELYAKLKTLNAELVQDEKEKLEIQIEILKQKFDMIPIDCKTLEDDVKRAEILVQIQELEEKIFDTYTDEEKTLKNLREQYTALIDAKKDMIAVGENTYVIEQRIKTNLNEQSKIVSKTVSIIAGPFASALSSSIGHANQLGDALKGALNNMIAMVAQAAILAGITSVFGGGSFVKSFLSFIGLSQGGPVYASSGFRPQGTDIVPAMLTPGEVVIPKSAVTQNQTEIGNLLHGKNRGSGNVINITFPKGFMVGSDRDFKNLVIKSLEQIGRA